MALSERMRQEQAEGAQAARPTWRCWFCDEVFTTPGEAGDHFGATLTDKPGCLIDYQVQVEAGTTTQRGRGLLMALRRAEAELMRYGSEDTDLHRAMHRMESEHRQALIREEEKGCARGLRDGVNLPADSPERAALTCGVSVGQPAHSKSEYKRRVAMGDPNVAPPPGVTEARAPRYLCNKCGATPHVPRHQRPDGKPCDYLAVFIAAGVKACDGAQG